MVAPSPLRVEVDSSPVYELLLQVLAFTGLNDLGSYDVGHRWGATQRARLTRGVERALTRLGGPRAGWDQLLGYQACARTRSVPDFLDRIERADPKEIREHMLGAHRHRWPREPPRRPALRASTLKDLVLEALSGWYERVFLRDEASVSELLADDARARRSLIATDPERLILIATGVRYVPNHEVDSVLLVPTLIMRPWLAVVCYRRTRIYCYPVLDDPQPGEAAVPSILLRTYEALADPSRLRILKALGTERLSAGQLADRLAEPKEAVRAHLARLRLGRLVQLTCGDDPTYERRTDLMRAVGQPLKSYLHLPSL